MKKFISFIICILICLDIIDNFYLNNQIENYIKNLFIKNDYIITINNEKLNSNKYLYNDLSPIAKNTDNFKPKNKNELINLYYTIMNNGFDDFTFYCDFSYTNCLDDINELSKDADTFTYLNQFVHPYNSFKTVNSKYIGLFKRVDVDVEKKYTPEDIKKIDNKINDIINKLNVNSYNSLTDKIKVFHDYIADNSKYDKNKENNTSQYNSDTAIGTLFQGYSTCSGYSDVMAIFLNKLGLQNIKVITDKHAWNAVKIDNKWYHIDLTWDDPIVTNGGDIISHEYFMISTDELLNKDISEHSFDKELYNFLN